MDVSENNKNMPILSIDLPDLDRLPEISRRFSTVQGHIDTKKIMPKNQEKFPPKKNPVYLSVSLSTPPIISSFSSPLPSPMLLIEAPPSSPVSFSFKPKRGYFDFENLAKLVEEGKLNDLDETSSACFSPKSS